MDPRWLDWARRLQAIAQNGLTFSTDPFDRERYQAARAIAAEIMAAGSEAEVEAILALFARDKGYATPKTDVRGVVFRGDDLLLVRERSDGLWALPGGWADIGCSPSENLVKEIREEAGFETRVVKLLALYDKRKHDHAPDNPHHTYKLYFLCEILAGEATPGIETSAVDFFPVDAIPPLSTGRVTAAQIARMFEHRRHPDWPADFD